MEKQLIKTLLISDSEIDCEFKNKITLTDLSLDSTVFNCKQLKDYDLVVYNGLLGSKILKSKYFRTGKIN